MSRQQIYGIRKRAENRLSLLKKNKDLMGEVIKLRRRASRKTKPVVTADNGLATTQTCTMVEIRSSRKMKRKRQPTWCTEVRCYPPSRDKAVRQMTLGTVQVADYLAWSRKQNDSGLGRRNHDLMLSSVSQAVPFP